MHKLLDQLVAEMVNRGIRYEDARREFEKRFLAQVIQKSDGNLCKAADVLGVHRNTLARKVKDLKIKASDDDRGRLADVKPSARPTTR